MFRIPCSGTTQLACDALAFVAQAALSTWHVAMTLGEVICWTDTWVYHQCCDVQAYGETGFVPAV